MNPLSFHLFFLLYEIRMMLVSTLSSWVINLPFDPLSKKFRNAFLFTVFCSLKGYYNLFLEKEQSNIWVLFFSCFIKAKNDLMV